MNLSLINVFASSTHGESPVADSLAHAVDSISHAAGTLAHAADTVAHAAGAHGGGHEGGSHELPNIVMVLYKVFGEPFTALHHWENIFFAFLALGFLCVMAMIIYRKRTLIPGKLQNFAELIVEGLYNFFHSILGEHARKYTPFLGTLFIYILTMNWMGMIPFFKAASSSATITVSLAIIVFFYSQSVGLKHLGFGGWFFHLLGQPKSVIEWCLSPLFFLIHLIGEVAKPLSLALRLFGNITGEDILIAAFTGIGIMALSFMHSPVGLPFQFPFYFLGLLLSTIQALVFTSLSAIYIFLMLPHHHEGAEH